VSLNVQGTINFLNIIKMKKSILNLGKALDKAEQKEVNGGNEFLACGGVLCETISYCKEYCDSY